MNKLKASTFFCIVVFWENPRLKNSFINEKTVFIFKLEDGDIRLIIKVRFLLKIIHI